MRVEGLSSSTSSEAVSPRSKQGQVLEQSQHQLPVEESQRVDSENRYYRSDEESLEGHVDRLNKLTKAFEKKLSFEIHEASDRVMVRVVNQKTGESVAEIPPEEVLDMVARINDMVGLIIDQKV